MYIKHIFCILIFTFCLYTDAVYSQQDDKQFWGIASVQAALSPKISIRIEEQFNLSQQSGLLEYQHNDIALKIFPKEWLVIRPAYRQVYLFMDGGITEENRYHINATFKWCLGHFEFSNLNRVEHRTFKGMENYTRFRNILRIHYPLHYKQVVFRPLIEEQFWFNEYKEIEFNILYTGIMINPIEPININIHYIWGRRQLNNWYTIHGFGLRFRVIV